MTQIAYINRVHEWLADFQQDARAAAPSSTSAEALAALESLIDMALGLHTLIAQIEASLNEQTPEGQLCDIADAEALQHLYALWLAPAKKIVDAIKLVEKNSAAIRHAAELRKAVGFCYLPRTNIRQVREDSERLLKGEGVVVTEFP